MSREESQVRRDFYGKGYALMRGVLSEGEVSRLREICDAFYAENPDVPEMPASEFIQHPELARIPFRRDVVEELRGILGEDYVTYPNFIVRKGNYQPWHVDSGFSGPGKEYVWDPKYAHVQCVIYLQDNDPELGGGLEAVEGSHMPGLPVVPPNSPVERLARAGLNRVARKHHRIDGRAGDLVMWHARTMHRSTPPRRESPKTKYGVFFSAGLNDPFFNTRYLTHLVAQSVQRENGSTQYHPRYHEIADLRWPESYPEHVLSAAREVGEAVKTF